jgi:thioredoxin reductase
MIHDALIIGGSYAGLSAALMLARARRQVVVVDSHRPRNRFADASHGFFGFDGAAPEEMIGKARADLLAYPTVRFVDGQVASARAEGEAFVATLESGETLTARKVLLAFGLTDILPDLPGLAQRWGVTVLHCPYCHGYELGDQRRGVLQTQPMSSHQALHISDWGPTTLFLDGKDELDDETRVKLKKREVAIEPGKVASLEGEGTALAGVRLADGRLVPVAALYLAARNRMTSSLVEQLGCALDDGMLGPLVRTDSMKATTVPGVYAAGDIARFPPGAMFAAADGMMAGVAMHQSLIFGPLG